MSSNLAVLHSYSVYLFFTNVAPVIPWMLFYAGDFFGRKGLTTSRRGRLKSAVGGLSSSLSASPAFSTMESVSPQPGGSWTFLKT